MNIESRERGHAVWSGLSLLAALGFAVAQMLDPIIRRPKIHSSTNIEPASATMAKPDIRMLTVDAREFVSSFLTGQSTYHDHKETTTYSGVVLYLGGATWLVMTDPPPWAHYTPWEFWGLLGFVAPLGVVGWFFVRWQMSRRREAAIQVAAGYNLLGRWLTQPIATRDEMRPSVEQDSPIQWPEALRQAIDRVRPAQAKRLRWGEWLTYVTMLVAGGAALVRLLHSSPPAWWASVCATSF